MHVLQVSPTQGERCGVAYFADDLAREISGAGLSTVTVRSIGNAPWGAAPDVILIHYHEDLSMDNAVREIRRRFRGPVVLFAHSEHRSRTVGAIEAVITMAQPTGRPFGMPALTISHPAWTPRALTDRSVLRRALGLPSDLRIVGTCGFLRFDREFVEIASTLLPKAVALGWSIRVLTSPWRIDSPGLLERLESLQASAPDHVMVEHDYLPHEALNRQLQACDLVWCWTREPSSTYASGVASCLYASGSRVLVAGKRQHAHVAGLPNVVWAPARLDRFIEAVAAEMARPEHPRHDPDPISWRYQARRVRSFLERIVATHRVIESGRLMTTE